MIGRKGMTIDELRLALKLVDERRNVPTEYTFLRDARGSLRDRSHDRAARQRVCSRVVELPNDDIGA